MIKKTYKEMKKIINKIHDLFCEWLGFFLILIGIYYIGSVFFETENTDLLIGLMAILWGLVRLMQDQMELERILTLHKLNKK